MLDEIVNAVGQILGWTEQAESPSSVPENSQDDERQGAIILDQRSHSDDASSVTMENPSEAAALQVPTVVSEARSEEDTSTEDVATSASGETLRHGSVPLPVAFNHPEESLTLQSALSRSSGHTPRIRGTSVSPKLSGHHRRTSSSTEVSASLSSAMADLLQNSWANSSSAETLQYIPSSGLDTSRPPTVSRLSSNASASSAPALNSSASLVGEDSLWSGLSSAIHDAARITNWDAVKRLCEDYPEAAKFVGKDRWTALHHACNRRCPREDVVEALLRAYPDALLLEVEKGWYPLHFACRFKAPKEVVRLLVHMYPDKGMQSVQKLDRQGRTALYYAVRYDAPAGVVGILLDVDPSVVLEEDQNADSPLGLVWDQWAEKLEGKRTLQRIYGSSPDDESREDKALRVAKRLETQTKVLERWNKVNVFLRAAFGFFPVDDGSTSGDGDEEIEPSLQPFVTTADGRLWRSVHATAAIKCHLSLFHLACALYPEQASEYDEGDLRGPPNISGGWNSAKHLSALHLAASSQAHGETGRAVLHELLAMNPSAVGAKDGAGALPLHRLAGNKAKAHWIHDGIAEIYDAYPDAARTPDCDGRLPLHWAATAIVEQGEATAETITQRSVICNILNLHPDASAHADNFGRLPLHLAVQSFSSWDIQLQLLLDQYPQAVRARTGVKLGNLLPLHIATSNPSADLSMIQRLVEAHPRAASQASRDGMLPLHYACVAGLDWESVRVLHEANPEAVRQVEQNSRRLNALQMAASCTRADKELLENLLALYPDAASATDTKGRHALHLACIAGKSWDTGLSALFDAYPEAIGRADSMGLLPFYIACFRYCSASEIPQDDGFCRLAESASRHHRRNSSSRISMDLIHKEQAMEAEATRQIEILFHLLKADPTVLY